MGGGCCLPCEVDVDRVLDVILPAPTAARGCGLGRGPIGPPLEPAAQRHLAHDAVQGLRAEEAVIAVLALAPNQQGFGLPVLPAAQQSQSATGGGGAISHASEGKGEGEGALVAAQRSATAHPKNCFKGTGCSSHSTTSAGAPSQPHAEAHGPYTPPAPEWVCQTGCRARPPRPRPRDLACLCRWRRPSPASALRSWPRAVRLRRRRPPGARRCWPAEGRRERERVRRRERESEGEREREGQRRRAAVAILERRASSWASAWRCSGGRASGQLRWALMRWWGANKTARHRARERDA